MKRFSILMIAFLVILGFAAPALAGSNPFQACLNGHTKTFPNINSFNGFMNGHNAATAGVCPVGGGTGGAGGSGGSGGSGGEGGLGGDAEIGDVHVTDNSVYRTDYDFPVNTAAPVFAGNCSQGVSAQTMGFGGSIASGNSVCDYIAVSGALIAGGNREEAFRVIGKAEEAADWRFFFSRVRMVITLGIL